MPMGRPLKLALIGADEPLGEALLKVLEARDIEPEAFWPVSLDEEEGATITRMGREVACLDAADLDWSRIDVLVLASLRGRGREVVREANRRGIAVLGTQATLGGTAEPVSRGEALPDAPATALLRVLAPLAASAGLVSLHAFVGLPVAALGSEGVTELATQTRALFALESAEPAVLPVRIAFNLLPVSVGAGPERDEATETQLRIALAPFGTVVQTSSIWIPVFHGGVAALHVRTREPLSESELRALWSRTAGVIVMDEPLPGGVPTPATEAVDSEDVFIGRLRVNAADPTYLSCWLCFDHPRLEAARLAVWLEEWLAKTD